MKTRALALAALACLAVPSASWADSAAAHPSHLISLDVGHFVYSLVPPSTTILVPLEYEGAVNGNVSLYVAPRFAVRAGVVGFGVGVGARFYFLNGPAISGLWLGPELGVLYGAATPTSFTGALAFSLGGAIGYNILIGSSLVLSPGVNIGVIGLGAPTLGVDFSPRLVAGYAF